MQICEFAENQMFREMDAEQLAEMIAEPYRHLSEFGYDLPNGLVLAWLPCGPAFQLEFDLETDRGADDLMFWWVNGGKRNCPGIGEELDREILQKLHVRYLTASPSSELIPFTPLLSLIYRHREDLRVSFDIDTAVGRNQMWYWWLSFGLQEHFQSPDWLVVAQVKALHCLDTSLFRKTGLIHPTPMAMLAWKNRPARQQVEVASAAGQSVLWQTFLTSEAITFRLPNRGLPYIPDEVSRTESDCSDTVRRRMPPSLAVIRAGRADLQAAFQHSEDGVSSLVYWWLTDGRGDFPDLRDQLDRDLLQSLHLDCLPAGDDATLALTPLLIIIRDHRPDLMQIGAADGGSLKIWRWWYENGRVEFFGQLDWLVKEELRSRLGTPQPKPSPANASDQSASTAMPSRQNGAGRKSSNALESVSANAEKSRVGLFGYAKGEFGLGEDVRLLRAALDGANVANVVINAPWQILARQSIDEPSVEAANARFDSDVMFYVMPPFDTVTLLNKMGPRAFSARRRIGFWQWELARFPDPAKLALNLVDEIWCHSEHAANAFRKATDKPVIKVPLPVFVPETRIVSRATFGLPERAFVIFTSFDGASAIARKNPLASILSFQQAFPTGRSIDARLIVKAMNTNNDSLWRECLRRASVDERIVIIDTVMDRKVYYELLRACDAVVSLHRAEGFGRLMAEAMALGVPVIASRYSGNLDFMTDQNSWLIDGDLIPVLPGDYAFHHGQVWLEPSVEKAAIALRECTSNREKRQQRATRGMADIASKHSLKVCGETYSKLLDMKSTELNLLTAG